MFRVLIGFLPLCSFCYAKPVQTWTNQSLNPNGRTGGFPAEYMSLQLSTPNTSKNGTLTLALPLNPAHHGKIEQEITTSTGIPPRGTELVASIETRIYDNWRDIANRPTRRRVDDRRLPFRNFEFITEPSRAPGAALTPLKLGIVYCWILYTVVESPDWPGRIMATIWHAIPGVERHALQVGTLEIRNSPLHDEAFSEKQLFGAASPINDTAIDKKASVGRFNDTAPGLKPTSGSSATAAIKSLRTNPIEKRWLSCYTTALFHALTFSSSDIVRDRWSSVGPPEPPSDQVTFHLSCNPIRGQRTRDRFHMSLTPQVRGKPVLTFAKLIPAMLAWITRLAETEGAWFIPEFIGGLDQFVILFIEIAGAAPPLALDHVTATA